MTPVLSYSLHFLLLSLAVAAPNPSAVDLAERNNAPVVRAYLSEAVTPLNGTEFDDENDLQSRQDSPYTGTWYADWGFGGQSQSFRISPVSKWRAHYVGDAWNDRISSIRVNSGPFYCKFYNNYDQRTGCSDLASIIWGGQNDGQLAQNHANDRISCYECGP